MPAEVFDISSVELTAGGNWWETRETIETLDASQNEIASVPEALRQLPELRELEGATMTSVIEACDTACDDLTQYLSAKQARLAPAATAGRAGPQPRARRHVTHVHPLV